ncbi:MAG TPA: hypothetical protein PKG54_00990 [Phycisphaerae bacterium]|nr:hypothetical protein [Phycisphaerae bacterium]HOB73075.1 hypothetical protein [Phycisphaerae bacterium]HOJ54044.1 hypothetical protein [Phycisphaerae bacterium]HOL26455.1 hypothetical protein [Phycisphaerae bacterium]HPP20434.1 hypothetical protein [Phycisphaerae bacterium]
MTLVSRAGGDTLAKFESAARLRFREAERLYEQGEALGAIYLYGYSVEICLKAAYYRTIGLVPSSAIDFKLHRKPAENEIDGMEGLLKHPVGDGPKAGRHVVGWARLLESTRGKPGGKPMDSDLATRMHEHALTIFECWAEFLRYRGNKPYNKELEAVRTAANWFRRNASRLWR